MGQLDLIADQAAEKVADRVSGAQAAKATGQAAIQKPPAPAPQPAPEMQAAVDQAKENIAKGAPAPTMNATQAGIMGLPAQVPEVVPTDAEIAAATTPVDPATSRGYAEPGLSLKDVQPPLAVPPDSSVAATPSKPSTYLPVIGQQATTTPSTKQMIAKVLSGKSGPSGPVTSQNAFNFADLLKGASGKLGDFLQRWGMGLQGAPEGKTQGDIQRQQAFELQKQQIQAEVTARQMALDNKYQTDRMQLQNQMNMANLPVEMKAQLQNRLAELDAQYQQELKLMPLRIQQEYAIRGMSPGADPGAHFVGQ